jgi:hypothetical protein
MKNSYEVRGDVTAIFLKKKDGTVLETLIDTSDLEFVGSIRGTWYANWDKTIQGYYVKAGISRDGTVKKIPLHRFIMGEPKGLTIDHRNHDTLNNTKNNLRPLTSKQNQQNRKRVSNRNTSGERGVSWHKRDQKWIGQVVVDGVRHWIGGFEDKQECIEAVRKARKELLPYSTN